MIMEKKIKMPGTRVLLDVYEENPYEDDTSIDLEDSYDEDEIIRMNERNHLKNQNIMQNVQK